MTKEILATSKYCAPCQVLKDELALLNIEVEIKDSSTDFKYFIDNNIKTVPILILEDGEKIQGPSQILNHLKDSHSV